MQNIDFSKIPNIREKISDQEIRNLNNLFASKDVISELQTIQAYQNVRKKRAILAMLISGFLFFPLVAIFLSQDTSKVEGLSRGMMHGIVYLYALVPIIFIGGLFFSFGRKKVEGPLRDFIVPKIGSLLHPSFQYSSESTYGIDDFPLLKEKGFFNFQKRGGIHDSLKFSLHQDIIQFNVQASKASEFLQGLRGKKDTCFYVIKIVFPHARIPLQTDVLVSSQDIDVKKPNTINILILLCASFGIPFYVYSILPTEEIEGIGRNDIFWVLIGISSMMAFFFVFIHIVKYIRSKKIFLENIDFEKNFNVYSSDQISSRMILTPAIMESILEYSQKNKNFCSFLFTSNTVYVKKIIHPNYMQVSTRKNILHHPEVFLEVYLNMRRILTLARDLNFFYLSQTVEQKDIVTREFPL